LHASFLALTVSKSSLFTPSLLRTHSFISFAVHEIRRIFLSPFISKASRRVSSFFPSVQLSQPYVATGHTRSYIDGMHRCGLLLHMSHVPWSRYLRLSMSWGVLVSFAEWMNRSVCRLTRADTWRTPMNDLCAVAMLHYVKLLRPLINEMTRLTWNSAIRPSVFLSRGAAA